MPIIDLPAAAMWLATIALLLAAAIRAAIPAGHRRPVSMRLLVRALLPTRLLRTASGRLDIAAFVAAKFVLGAALGWALVSSNWWFEIGQHALGPGPAAARLPAWLGLPLVTAVLFVAYEAAYWGNHWLSHNVPALWAFHKVHHSAKSLSLLTNFRVHPVDTIVFYNMASACVGLTGAVLVRALGPVPQIGVGGVNAIVFVASILLSYLQHSQLWIAFPGRLGGLVLSPAHHQLHHSVDPAHYGSNLGSTLAVFDRAWGTLLRPSAKRMPLRFGVDGQRIGPHGVRGALLHPFAEAVSAAGPPSAPRYRADPEHRGDTSRA